MGKNKKRKEKLTKFDCLIKQAFFWVPKHPLELKWSKEKLELLITRNFAFALIAKRLEDLKKQWITLQKEKDEYEEYRLLLTENDSERKTLDEIFDLQGRGKLLHDKTIILENILQQMESEERFLPPSSEVIPWQGIQSHEIKVLWIEKQRDFLLWLNKRTRSAFQQIHTKLKQNNHDKGSDDIQLTNECIANLLHNNTIFNQEVNKALIELKAWDKEHDKTGDIEEKNAWKMITEHIKQTKTDILYFISVAQQYKNDVGFFKN